MARKSGSIFKKRWEFFPKCRGQRHPVPCCGKVNPKSSVQNSERTSDEDVYSPFLFFSRNAHALIYFVLVPPIPSTTNNTHYVKVTIQKSTCTFTNIVKEIHLLTFSLDPTTYTKQPSLSSLPLLLCRFFCVNFFLDINQVSVLKLSSPSKNLLSQAIFQKFESNVLFISLGCKCSVWSPAICASFNVFFIHWVISLYFLLICLLFFLRMGCLYGGRDILSIFSVFFRVWDGADNGLWVNEKKTSEYFLIFAYRFQVPSWLMNRSPYNLSMSCEARKWEDLWISAKLILDQDKATKGDVFRRVNFRQGYIAEISQFWRCSCWLSDF